MSRHRPRLRPRPSGRIPASMLAGPFLAALLAAMVPGSAPAALRAGDPMPYFRFPWLDGSAAPGSPELLAEAGLTALVVWNRSCPRCTGLALQCDQLADSLRGAGGVVRGLLFGPDDPSALQDRLNAEGIRTPHLWDPSGLIVRDLAMGDRHLGLFLVNQAGTILAALDDEIPELVGPVMAAWREAGTGSRDATARPDSPEAPAPPAAVPSTPAAVSSAPTAVPISPGATPRAEAPRPAFEGRLRFSSADGARSGDTGVSGETLESGTLVLTRWDLSWHLEVAPGLEFLPRLRISNEDETVLRDGAEPWANRYGTASLRFRRGRFRATAGALAERIAPLVLQRWDREDAPPPGGSAGCACGSAGVAGLSQRSLEIPGVEYTFEGISAGWSGPWARAHLTTAVPRWEKVSDSSDPDVARAESRYRTVLSAAVLDLGAAGSADPATGLGSPLGARLARLVVEDDRRTIDPLRAILPGLEQDESAWSLWLSIRPMRGLHLEGERAWWTREETLRESVTGPGRKRKTEARALRAGGALERSAGRLLVSGKLHWIRTDPGFEPAYRALTYEKDREGWRAALGLELRDLQGARERLACQAFHRALREAQDDPRRRALPGWGRVRERLTGFGLRARPARALLVETDLVLSLVDWPIPLVADERKSSVAVILRWQDWPGFDPSLRCDWIRYREGFGPAHSATQISLWLRVLP